MCDQLCIMPPSPELEDKILRTKEQVLAGKALPKDPNKTLLDSRTFSLIVGRPAKTRAHTFLSPTRDFAPVVGSRRALVLLVDFSDAPATQSQAHYTDMLFSLGAHAGGSMRDFYKEASYNKLDVIGAVHGTGGPTAGWFRAPQTKAYYTNNDYGFGTYPRNAQRLVEDIVTAANASVNFAPYDNDGDGKVDALVLICAGSGAEVTGSTGDIWSHKWGITPKTVDGVQVTNYFMAPEDGRVGVMAHELGHLLMGWPDLYDTDYSSAGTGGWDLMAGGSWNNGGNTPAHPSAWCKAKSGWVNPTAIFNTQQNVVVRPYATNDQVYKLPIGNTASKEYFLVSNRQQTGFDTHLPGEGLIVEHCDDNQTNNTDENHYLVDIEQADGQRHLNTNANRGDSTDPYPAAANNKFTVSSTPNSKAYDGSDSKVSIADIARSGDNITATINVGGAAAIAWVYNKSVLRTYASHDTKNAWAYLDGLGWRRIHPNAPDGVTNTFMGACEAVANTRPIDAYVDGSFLYRMQLV